MCVFQLAVIRCRQRETRDKCTHTAYTTYTTHTHTHTRTARTYQPGTFVMHGSAKDRDEAANGSGSGSGGAGDFSTTVFTPDDMLGGSGTIGVGGGVVGVSVWCLCRVVSVSVVSFWCLCCMWYLCCLYLSLLSVWCLFLSVSVCICLCGVCVVCVWCLPKLSCSLFAASVSVCVVWDVTSAVKVVRVVAVQEIDGLPVAFAFASRARTKALRSHFFLTHAHALARRWRR